MKHVKVLVAIGTTVAAFAGPTAALADAPNGNSGHNSNGDTQCKNSTSNPNCPPIGK
jgi:hypothetical protein